MNGREILLGVTGGIAAYKSADLASRLAQQGASVSVVMTAAATRFVGTATFAALTGHPVHTDLFETDLHPRGAHIELARRAEVVVIAPATASNIARLAHGLADDLLATCVLVATAPVLVAPAMNCEMWAKPAVQRNVQQLRDDGLTIIEPTAGWLSCGEVGAGRMAEPDDILQQIRAVLT